MLLKAEADVNADISCGRTTLFYVVLFEKNSSNPCIDLLLKAGADVNVTNNWGFSASIEAPRFVNASRMKTLIKAGADVSMINIRGDSAWHTAAMCDAVTDEEAAVNQTDSVKLLLRSGAKVNVFNPNNLNALSGFITPQIEHWFYCLCHRRNTQ